MDHVTDRTLSVRPLGPRDREWVDLTQAAMWGSSTVARKGELLDTTALPGFVAVRHGEPVGLALFCVRGDEYEVVSVSATVRREGVGRALMLRCFDDARKRGCRRVWLTTTNDNVGAIAFYQRLGMDLCAFSRNGVATARRLKPSIPLRDEFGVGIDHELEFELLLGADPVDDLPRSSTRG
ncbi:GNAT family N-acetyltransferase [Agromyces mariniharenae]|nr:GNAT family N-acetyltransferase [Agromyces mariniharenae]